MAEPKKKEIVKKLYFSKNMRATYQFSRGERKDGRDRPKKNYCFENHHMTLTKPEEQAEIESHDLFGTEILLVETMKSAPAVTYSDGPGTTGNEPDPAEGGLTGKEKASFTRCKGKLEQGLELDECTVIEQAAHEKAKKLGLL